MSRFQIVYRSLINWKFSYGDIFSKEEDAIKKCIELYNSARDNYGYHYIEIGYIELED